MTGAHTRHEARSKERRGAQLRSYALSLGSNSADPLKWLELAVARIGELREVSDLARSGDWESAAAGGPADQPPFVNTAVSIVTSLSAEELLPMLLGIETDLGRIRTVRWGPRPIDIDLILIGPPHAGSELNQPPIVTTPWLTVPHPRWAVRQFVLQPLSELVPQWLDPITGQHVADVRDGWLRWPHSFALAGFPADQIADWVAEAVARMPSIVTDVAMVDIEGDRHAALFTSGPIDRVPQAVFIPPEWYPHTPAGSLPLGWSTSARVPLEFDPVGEITAAIQAADPSSIRRLDSDG